VLDVVEEIADVDVTLPVIQQHLSEAKKLPQ
jgi:hypothetical protein